jgi:putative membrane protein
MSPLAPQASASEPAAGARPAGAPAPPDATAAPADALAAPAPEEARDATRRTRLANERTYLAWWRTGLAALAVGLGTGKLVPAVTAGAQWPYTVAGIGFSLIGIVFIAYAFLRHRDVEQAISSGGFAPPEERFMAALAVVGVLFGVFVLAIVAANGS